MTIISAIFLFVFFLNSCLTFPVTCTLIQSQSIQMNAFGLKSSVISPLKTISHFFVQSHFSLAFAYFNIHWELIAVKIWNYSVMHRWNSWLVWKSFQMVMLDCQNERSPNFPWSEVCRTMDGAELDPSTKGHWIDEVWAFLNHVVKMFLGLLLFGFLS